MPRNPAGNSESRSRRRRPMSLSVKWHRSRPGRSGGDQGGFTIIEMMIAITIIAVTFLSFSKAVASGLTTLQAGRERSAFMELANEELERVRALRFDALGVSTTDPNLASAYPSDQHDGREAVLLNVAALRAGDATFPNPWPAVEVVTDAPVSGVLDGYTIHRWITWSTAGGAGAYHEIKRIDITINWKESTGQVRKVELSSLRYPGNLGPDQSDDSPVPVATADATAVTV